MAEWVKVMELDAIPAEGAYALAGEEEILLVRDGQQVFAIAYLCSHQDMELEGGHREGGTWACPHHGARFDLRTGEAVSMPAVDPISVYPVRVEDGWVHVRVGGTP